jgi:hypothetical protein
MYHDKREGRGMAKVEKFSDAIRDPPPANGEQLVRKHGLLPCVHNYKERTRKSKQTAVDEGHFY